MNSNTVVTIKQQQIYAVTEKAVRYGPPGLQAASPQSRSRDERRMYWLPVALIHHRSKYAIGEVDDIEIPQFVADREELEWE